MTEETPVEHPLDARLRRKAECTSATGWTVVIADSWEHDPADALWVSSFHLTSEEAEAVAAERRTRLGEFESCYVYQPDPAGLWQPGA